MDPALENTSGVLQPLCSQYKEVMAQFMCALVPFPIAKWDVTYLALLETTTSVTPAIMQLQPVSPPSTEMIHFGMAMGVLVATIAVRSTILRGSVNSFFDLPQMILKSESVLMKLLIMRILPSGWLNSMLSNCIMTMAQNTHTRIMHYEQ